MAFVFRAKKDIKLSDIEQNNVYPGEYYKENQLVKHIEKQSSEFQSKSTRNSPDNKFNTPGPGSYEKNIIYYDIFGNFKKKKKLYNIYDTVKSNVIPKEVQKFLANNQAIAFNTRGGRFNYKIEELEKEKSRPGPGSYSPNTSMSLNSKKALNTNNDNTTNNKSNNTMCINSYNSSKTNNFSFNNKSFQSTNENTSSSKLVKKTMNFNSDYRTETIPSKGNLGYDFDQNGDKKMIINKESNYMSGKKNDSAGPGQYNIQLNWEKNILSWQKMKDEKDEKYNKIKERKNLSSLTQLEKDYLMNSQQKSTKYISKTKTGNYNTRTKLFNMFLNNRYNKIKTLNEKKDYDDFLFEGSPGPGYYNPHNTYFQSDNYSAYDKSKKNFTAKSPRFKTVNKANNDLGPGFYYNKNKPKKVEKPKYKSGFLDNPNKEDDICALKLSLAKESYKVPGPGSYEVEGNLLHEDVSNNQNFGTNDRRFKKSLEIINDYPGPGTYEQKNGCLSQENKNKNNINNKKNNNVYTNYKTDLELVKELDKIPKEEFSNPPVGLYNPNIISSMEYNVKSKINPYIDQKIVGFGVQDKKGDSLISKDNNRSVGPGRYYKSKIMDLKQNSSPFNQSDKRFNYEHMYNNKFPGPGSYEINSFDDWNKKSHNILFV